MSNNDKDSGKNKDKYYGPLIFGAGAVIAVGILIGNYWVLGGLPAAERSAYGEMFGPSNALLAGLAFAALFVQIHLQRKDITKQTEQLAIQAEELKLQRKELELNRKELRASGDALRAQVDMSRDAALLAALPQLIESQADFAGVTQKQLAGSRLRLMSAQHLSVVLAVLKKTPDEKFPVAKQTGVEAVEALIGYKRQLEALHKRLSSSLPGDPSHP